MDIGKSELGSLEFKIVRLKYEAQSVQFSQTERMRKKRQIRRLEKERSEWLAQRAR